MKSSIRKSKKSMDLVMHPKTLSRNGKIRNFLAQTAAYVNHGSGANEEINLFGLDGSKPGAASAGVWLSHKVIGKFYIFFIHQEGEIVTLNPPF